MAHFRGTIQGNRGTASRLGTVSSGLSTTTNGWCLGVTADIFHLNDKDEINARLTHGSGYRNDTLPEIILNVSEDGDFRITINGQTISGKGLKTEKQLS